MSDYGYHGIWIKALVVLTICVAVGWTMYLGLSAPVNQNNICELFQTHPHWYWDSMASEHKWGVPMSEQMAIMQKESHFRSAAQPPHKRLLGFIPWQRVSSATGYMQALNSTWRAYLRATHQRSASREDFAKATDFIGWYITQNHHLTGVSKRDVFRNYLIYHEGVGGYRARSYDAKPWLISLAHRVSGRAKIYHRQLLACERHLPKQAWWRFW